MLSDNPTKQHKVCLNCGTPLTDLYCSHCGQKDIPRRQTLGELASNFLGSFTSFESKFFKTIKFMVLKPGLLPRDYIDGKRERYFHPARAYVFISFVFFLVFLWLPKEDANFELSGSSEPQAEKPTYESAEQYDSLQNLLPVEQRDGWFVRMIRLREIEIQKEYHGRDEEFKESFGSAFFGNFPKVFFLLLPLFALLLKLLYVRRDYFYSEHLVFSIYYYDFFFLCGIASMLLGLIPGFKWIQIVFFLWSLIYLLIGMKRMYEQPWWKTSIKFLLLCIVFAVCVSVGMLANLFITYLFI